MTRDELSEKDARGVRAVETSKHLRETNELFERIFSGIHMLVAYLDADSNFIRVNRAYAEADGRSPEFFAGKNHFDLYPNEENEAIFRRVAETGEPYVVHEKPFTYPYHPERGVTYWDWTLQPIKETDGSVSGLLFTLIDVTQRKRNELALKESESQFRMLVEQASEGIVTFDRNSVILEANSAACELSGYSAEELIGRDYGSLITAEDRAKTPLRLDEMAAGNSIFLERRIRRKDGAVISVEGSAKMLPDGRFQAILRDVTPRKNAEEEIKLYQQRLRLMASQLSLAEERERRRVSKDIHDHVGQALALCQMKLGTLQEQAPSDDFAGSLTEVRDYISRVIAYARSLTYELGSPILYELGIEAAIQNLAETFQKDYGIPCRTECAGRTARLSSDTRIVLFRAVRELLANVAKHASAGSASVSIVSEDSRVTVCVQDNGKGFDPSRMDSRVYDDQGFGLFSIRERLEHLGGGMEIESGSDCGTRVVLHVPLVSDSP